MNVRLWAASGILATCTLLGVLDAVITEYSLPEGMLALGALAAGYIFRESGRNGVSE